MEGLRGGEGEVETVALALTAPVKVGGAMVALVLGVGAGPVGEGVRLTLKEVVCVGLTEVLRLKDALKLCTQDCEAGGVKVPLTLSVAHAVGAAEVEWAALEDVRPVGVGAPEGVGGALALAAPLSVLLGVTLVNDVALAAALGVAPLMMEGVAGADSERRGVLEGHTVVELLGRAGVGEVDSEGVKEGEWVVLGVPAPPAEGLGLMLAVVLGVMQLEGVLEGVADGAVE